MSEESQKEYIKYLEERLEKLSKKSSVEDQDLDTLIDTENEIIANNLYGLKKILNESNQPNEEIELLQKKLAASEEFIQYLMNSFWWKTTYPFRLLSRQLKKKQSYQPFNFSEIQPIEDETKILIYVHNSEHNLKNQIENLQNQKGLKNFKIVIIDTKGSEQISKFAKSNHIEYINYSNQKDSIIFSKNPSYLVYLNQDTLINNDEWLYKMVRPLVENYTSLSLLFNQNNQTITRIEKETFFNELKSRIIKIDRYKCLFLPANRNKVQYIPSGIINEASVIAKKCQSIIYI